MALLDIRLPGRISGPMIGERLRQSVVLGNMAIVLMTAYRLSPREEQAVMAQSGCDMLLYKPLPNPQDFKRLMADVIAQRC
jgi:CheY-like chemotaxis protein